jgi:Reverse transcriptase (RNA-dependent DNA polymerase)
MPTSLDIALGSTQRGDPGDDPRDTPEDESVGECIEAAGYPTSSPTPPAALLAYSIQSIQEPAQEHEHSSNSRAKRMPWRAAFYAGRLSARISRFQGRAIDRAQVQRLREQGRLMTLKVTGLPPPPKSHYDLKNHAFGALFEQAEIDHLESHSQTNSWTEISRRDPRIRGKQIISCMWVYVYKTDKYGRFQKCKARLVVRGDQEKATLRDTYAATLAGRSFRTLMAIAARFDLELLQFDIVNAFVNAELPYDVFMTMPLAYRKPGMLLRLNKALYGLRVSPLLWQKEFTSTLSGLNLVQIPHEPCCYTRNGVTIFFYVDDIALTFRKAQESEAQELINALKQKYELTGGHELQWFLGIQIIQDRQRRLIWLSQSAYIEKISRLVDKKSSPCNSPMASIELLPYEGLSKLSETRRYQKKIGSLLYAAVITRPDIAFATSRLARFLINPSPSHQNVADRVLCYLDRTKALALQFGGGNDLVVSSDASFADNSIDRKSSQAYAMKLFGGLIGWRANKQDTVTTSTTEAELLALSQTTKEALYVSRLIQELSVRLDDQRIRIQCDNQQTIRLVTAETALLQTKLRHVDIHNHWLRQEVSQGRIIVEYTPSQHMLADGLTKVLQNNAFRAFVQQLGLVDITDKLGIELQELIPEDHFKDSDSD